MHTTNVRKPAQLPPILQLVSPTLPIGAYAYSTGLEYAVFAGWVNDAATAHNWIADIAVHNLCHLDLPVMRRMYASWAKDDLESVIYWSRILTASRETSELLEEDRAMGIALARLLSDLGIERARTWRERAEANWAAMFSLASIAWAIGEEDMLFGYLWAWCEHQVAAAVKLIPLGQTSGQKILLDCCDRLPRLVDHSRMIKEEDIGQTSPALAIASSLHEQQYSRLFRS